MGVHIPDMELPSSCLTCDIPVRVQPCPVDHDNVSNYKTSRHPACPLIPVVRCKDCRFARFGPEWIICENFNGLFTTALGLEDFCSQGERRPQDGKL